MDPKMDQCYNICHPYTDEANSLRHSAYDLTNFFDYSKKSNTSDIFLSQLLSSIKLLNWLIINEVSCFEGSAMLETLYYCKFCWRKSWDRFEAAHEGEEMTPASPHYPTYLVIAYCKALMVGMRDYVQLAVDADIYEGG